MMRIGQSIDIHQLVEGRPLILGGVEIPYEKGLKGHSDADVLLHAIIESIIGAMGLGDIGKHFPDTDPKYKGADSLMLLKEVVKLLDQNGYYIENIDSTIIAQAPKMKDYILTMRENIAKACNIDVDRVSVKATTEEHLGFTGRKEGISAHSVCLINEKN